MGVVRGKFLEEELEEGLCSGRERFSGVEDGFNVCAGAVLARGGLTGRKIMRVLYYCF